MKTILLFWNWIQSNEKKLQNLQNENPEIRKLLIFWLEKHLHYYCPKLDAIIMFPTKENKAAQLIISANGNPEYCKQAIDLIDNAPKLNNWKFTAFIQPKEDIENLEAGLDRPYVFKDINLKISELKFIPFQYENSKKINMIVYLKNYMVLCHNHNLIQLIFIIVKNLIGEKPFYENINFVELAQLPDQENNELIYLFDLQYYLDEINKQNSNFNK